MKKIIFPILSILLFSCQQKEAIKPIGTAYFDIKDYFDKEANRLNQLKPLIEKSVGVNNNLASRKLIIEDWNKELASFINADINKASWKGEFTENKIRNITTYTTNNQTIPIKKIEINENSGKIKGIKIFKSTQNYLYQSADTLFYFPDSLYLIKNQQNIRFLKTKTYRVKGMYLK